MSREAMKLALEALEEITDEVFSPYDNKLGKAITALREALAEQPARPYRQLQDNGSKYFGESWDKAAQHALDKKAENARELGLDYEPAQDSGIVTAGGFDPRTQRTWVGLTDEEYINITDSVYHKGQGLVAYYKAIEAKLRSKNNG